MHKIIGIDIETSGFNKGEDITLNHQMVSIGLVITDLDFKILDEFYTEIKLQNDIKIQPDAYKIHGLSEKYLNENGKDEEQAVCDIVEFLMKHVDINDALFFMGHNARNFDLVFLKKLLAKYDISLKIAHRVIDSFSVGFVALKTKDSNELFDMFYEKRNHHNALDDIKKCVGACRKIRILVNACLNE